MPVPGLVGGEGPFYTLEGQAGLDFAVLSDVDVIVEVDEIEILYVPEGREGANRQNQADAKSPICPFVVIHYLGKSLDLAQFILARRNLSAAHRQPKPYLRQRQKPSDDTSAE